MSVSHKFALARIRLLPQDERGQALPLMAMMLVVLLGMGGLVLDIGHTMYYRSELQATTDAAALAGAQALPDLSASSVATNFSAIPGARNYQANLPSVTIVSGYPKLECLTSLLNQGEACSAPASANAIQVQQQVTLPLYFASLFGNSNYTVTTTATASMRGGSPAPYNLAIIMDSTLSMNEGDDDCGAGVTQIQCALNGVQILMQQLHPCSTTTSTCIVNNGVAENSFDRVSLFTFPNLTPGTVSINTSCTSPVPTANSQNGFYNVSPYGNLTIPNKPWAGIATAAAATFPIAGSPSYTPDSTATYQITPFLSDYRASNTAGSLNSSSLLAKAIGAVPQCGGMLPPNYEALYTTYYAGALYAAQSALVAQQGANPGSKNVIVFLSDGDANAAQSTQGYAVVSTPATNSGTYPSWVNECGQGVTAAQAATAAGTTVYSIAYGSPPSGCSTDKTGITPCQAMTSIASNPQTFFSDYTQSGSNSNCVSAAQPSSSLSQIFTEIANNLSGARLIPDNTT